MFLSLSFVLVPVLLLAPARSDNKMKQCPDRSLCNENGTCCKLQSGRYSCCMHTNAVCCTTRTSCCPEHYVCIPSSNLCAKAPKGHMTTAATSPFTTSSATRTAMTSMTQTPIATEPLREFTFPLLADEVTQTTTMPVTQTPVATEPPLEVAVPFEGERMQKCPADETYCFQGNNTCCRFGYSSEAPDNVTFGCCPDKDAVCCDDLVNCCPRGFNCIGNTGNCVQTAPIARSGDLLPSRMVQHAAFEPRHVSAMRLEAGRQRPSRPVVVKN